MHLKCDKKSVYGLLNKLLYPFGVTLPQPALLVTEALGSLWDKAQILVA